MASLLDNYEKLSDIGNGKLQSHSLNIKSS